MSSVAPYLPPPSMGNIPRVITKEVVEPRIAVSSPNPEVSDASTSGNQASPIIETSAVSSSNNGSETVQSSSAEAPTKLSALIVALVRSESNGLQELLQKLQSASTSPETKMSDSDLSKTLDDLLKVANDPAQLQKMIQDLDPNFCASLKVACQSEGEGLKKYVDLAVKLLEHGQVIGEYTHATDNVRAKVLASLKLMSGKDVNSDPAKYSETLVEFKKDLASLINDHNKVIEGMAKFKGAQAILLKNADANFNNALANLIEKYSSIIHKSDAENLSTDLTAAAKQTKEDPNAAHTLDKYMKMLFTPEGAAVGAMLVPFLASILSGTIGQLPVIGPFLQPILGLSMGVADMAQKLVQTISMLNQATTSRQVAEMQQKSSPPPANQSQRKNPADPAKTSNPA